VWCGKLGIPASDCPESFCCGQSEASIDFPYGFRLQERQVKGNPDVSS
jgi:hypothetical protein